MTAHPMNISAEPLPAPGIYWQSRMGNNRDGIGGNCHLYRFVAAGEAQPRAVLVDYGIKFGNGKDGFACEFPSPEGLLAKRGGPPLDTAPEALLLTHSHEDHIGAIRHVIDMGYKIPPIHCTAFTAQMVEKSLRRAGLADSPHRPSIHVVPTSGAVTIGQAEVRFVPVDHLPGASALLLKAGGATVFHSGDYKFDASLPLDRRADPQELRRIGQEGVDLVVADSTSAGDENPKFTEAQIAGNLTKLIGDQKDRAVIAGILGSQMDRLVSLGQAAAAHERALIVTGSSLIETVNAAERAGLDLEKAIGAPLYKGEEGRHFAAHRALVVTTGAFAQELAGLTRAAEEQPGSLYIAPDTTVIIPQRAIPPVAEARQAMEQKLRALGARVITAENAPDLGYGALHQSGHATAADSRLLYSLLQPRHAAAPIHGGPQQIAKHVALTEKLGVPTRSLPNNGVILHISHSGVRTVGQEPLQRIAAHETDRAKSLPRAKPGEGPRGTPPKIYRYDSVEDGDGKFLRGDVARYDGPTRVTRQAKLRGAGAAAPQSAER